MYLPSFLRKAYNRHLITFTLVVIITTRRGLAYIFENDQDYKIRQIKAFGLDTFPYGISTQWMVSLQ
jgi:hypothetical protein